MLEPTGAPFPERLESRQGSKVKPVLFCTVIEFFDAIEFLNFFIIDLDYPLLIVGRRGGFPLELFNIRFGVVHPEDLEVTGRLRPCGGDAWVVRPSCRASSVVDVLDLHDHQCGDNDDKDPGEVFVEVGHKSVCLRVVLSEFVLPPLSE